MKRAELAELLWNDGGWVLASLVKNRIEIVLNPRTGAMAVAYDFVTRPSYEKHARAELSRETKDHRRREAASNG